jgi:hypothetical protein
MRRRAPVCTGWHCTRHTCPQCWRHIHELVVIWYQGFGEDSRILAVIMSMQKSRFGENSQFSTKMQRTNITQNVPQGKRCQFCQQSQFFRDCACEVVFVCYHVNEKSAFRENCRFPTKMQNTNITENVRNSRDVSSVNRPNSVGTVPVRRLLPVVMSLSKILKHKQCAKRTQVKNWQLFQQSQFCRDCVCHQDVVCCDHVNEKNQDLVRVLELQNTNIINNGCDGCKD